jgi:hypothetical protein
MRRRRTKPRGSRGRVFATEPALSEVEAVGILTSTLTLRKAKRLTDERGSLPKSTTLLLRGRYPL